MHDENLSHEKLIYLIYITLFGVLIVNRVMVRLIKKLLISLSNEAPYFKYHLTVRPYFNNHSAVRPYLNNPRNLSRTFEDRSKFFNGISLSISIIDRFLQSSKRSFMLHLSFPALSGYAYNNACAFPFLSPFYLRYG